MNRPVPVRANASRVAVGLVLASALGVVQVADAASIQGPRRSALERLEEGDAIRGRLLLRGGRFELTPSFGFTLNDAFQRNILFGGHLAYHISDDWAIGATVLAGTPVESDLAERIGEERPEKVGGDTFANIGLLGTLEGVYTPVIGKFALFGRSVLNYDIHAVFGVGATMVSGSSDVEGATPTGVIGVGMRTFVANGFAVNVEVRDYIYSSALNAVTTTESGESETDAESSISNNFALTFGLAIYFPQDPKVSD